MRIRLTLALAVLSTVLVPTAASAQADEVAIEGLVSPTAVEFLPGGRVMVAEKEGVIRTFDNLGGGGGRTVLDHRDAVSSFGDLGFTALAYSAGHLYGAYTPTTPQGDVCDFGRYVAPEGRDPRDVRGCPATGRVSRWPVDAATGALGPEQVVLGGPDAFCVQFRTHGLDALDVLPDGDLLISAGDGASFAAEDFGQFGDNPCGDPAGAGGALRAQTDGNTEGKVLRLDAVTGALTVEAKGLRNPFRMSVAGNTVYLTDTGWGAYEELNRLELGGAVENFGWPCLEGSDRPGGYGGLEACRRRHEAGGLTGPLHAYPHGGASASISAVEEYGGRVYFGDYTKGFIQALDPAAPGAPVTVLARGEAGPVGVVDLKRTPDGRLVYVDIITGSIEAVGGGAVPEPPADPVATADVTLERQTPYQPGERIAFEVRTSFRNTVSYDWTVTLLTGCGSSGPGCTRRPLDFTGQGTGSGSFIGPDDLAPATVEVAVTVTNTMTGETVRDAEYLGRASGPAVVPGPGAEVGRIAGADRIGTAVEVSRRANGPGVPVAYVARADAFPDALAAGPLAAAAGGPILLTGPAALDGRTAEELRRLDPAEVVVLGGPDAVSDGVVAALTAEHGPVRRVAGPDRYATAAAVAAELDPSTVYVATGEQFPDALVGGVAAGRDGGAVVLTQAGDVPDATGALLADLAPERIVLLGGEQAASAAVEAELSTYAPVTRVFGADRYATAVAVSQAVPAAGTAYVATGEAFPDALAVAPTAVRGGAALVLTPADDLPAPVEAELDRLGATEILIVGGLSAVSGHVEAQLRDG